MVETFPVVVVSGARQVGKTTLVRHVFPQFDYVVFDPTIDVQNARQEPDLFLRNHPAPLVLDAIQYGPEVVAAIKRRVDAADARPSQYVVTGSQQWQVMRSISESLAGRAVFLDLDGFSLQELAGLGGAPGWLARWLESPADFVATRSPAEHAADQPLWDWLWRGFLPGVIESIGSLKKDVLRMKAVSLDLDETLIALAISAAVNPAAKAAVDRLTQLAGCEFHTTHLPTAGDEAGLRRLGVNVTADPNFASHALVIS